LNDKEILSLAKNAVANVARGCATAVVAVLLPPFLTRLMPVERYAAWVIVLQLSAYVAYLDFGIQTAIGRFVANANERGDPQYRDSIVSTAFATLTLAAAVAILAAGFAGFHLSQIFPKMPAPLVGEARNTLWIVAGTLALGLPGSAFNGVFVGLHRMEIPALTVGLSRIVGGILVVVAARSHADLVRMGAVMAAVNLASYAAQYLIYRRLASDLRASFRLVSRNSARILFDYCFSLVIWQFAMLLVTGLDLTLVGIFDFKAAGYYAVAASLIVFIAGLQNAIFGALIPSTAVLQARGDARELGRLTVATTRYGVLLLLLTGLPLIVAAGPILTLWVGPAYAAKGALVLKVLVAANIIRLSATPYVMTLIGAGQQRLVTVTPLVEGFTNLLVSVAAGFYFGAVGVALGTLVGSVVGVCGNYFYNMPRTTDLKFRRVDYFCDALLRPLACATPLLLFAVVSHLQADAGLPEKMIWVAAAFITTLFCMWRWGLHDGERSKLRFRHA